jgi:hypothetical protein
MTTKYFFLFLGVKRMLFRSLVLLFLLLTTSVAKANQRVSNTGAIFTRDTTIPALGEAYRDPSGLIWGSIVTAEGQVNIMDQYDAEKYCNAINTRLPTREEFEQLAKYLGKGTANGYSPYLADGKTEILPGLSSHRFWSSSVNPYWHDDAFYFIGTYGYFFWGTRYLGRESVRCVGGH